MIRVSSGATQRAPAPDLGQPFDQSVDVPVNMQWRWAPGSIQSAPGQASGRPLPLPTGRPLSGEITVRHLDSGGHQGAVLDVRHQRAPFCDRRSGDDFVRATPHNEGGQTRRPDCTGPDDPYLHLALLPRR